MPYHNWRRPLPCPIALPDVPLTLSTLEDVRALVPRHLPAEYRAKDTRQRIASINTAAVRSQLPADDAAAALRLVPSIEGIQCRQ